MESDKQYFSFGNMKKQPIRNFPFASNASIVRLAAAAKLSENPAAHYSPFTGRKKGPGATHAAQAWMSVG